jgi:hypothetical protein
MIAALTAMVQQMSPTITRRDVAEMPLLTLGQQFLGGNNNAIGKEVTTAVFLVLVAAAKWETRLSERRSEGVRTRKIPPQTSFAPLLSAFRSGN